MHQSYGTCQECPNGLRMHSYAYLLSVNGIFELLISLFRVLILTKSIVAIHINSLACKRKFKNEPFWNFPVFFVIYC